MKFEEALKECKENGKGIYRKGWNGKSQVVIAFSKCRLSFVETNQFDEEIYDMNDSEGREGTIFDECRINGFPVRDFLILITTQQYAVSWTPSITDVLADDWFIWGE